MIASLLKHSPAVQKVVVRIEFPRKSAVDLVKVAC